MRKNKLNYRLFRKMLSIVILLSFLKYPVFGEQPMMPPPNLNESGMRFWTDLEIDLLIDELTEAAFEAIEQAASEAARAAILSVLEREVAALREAERWRREAALNLQDFEAAKKAGRKNTLLGVLIGILGGLAVGVTGTLIIGR